MVRNRLSRWMQREIIYRGEKTKLWSRRRGATQPQLFFGGFFCMKESELRCTYPAACLQCVCFEGLTINRNLPKFLFCAGRVGSDWLLIWLCFVHLFSSAPKLLWWISLKMLFLLFVLQLHMGCLAELMSRQLDKQNYCWVCILLPISCSDDQMIFVCFVFYYHALSGHI